MEVRLGTCVGQLLSKHSPMCPQPVPSSVLKVWFQAFKILPEAPSPSSCSLVSALHTHAVYFMDKIQALHHAFPQAPACLPFPSCGFPSCPGRIGVSLMFKISFSTCSLYRPCFSGPLTHQLSPLSCPQTLLVTSVENIFNLSQFWNLSPATVTAHITLSNCPLLLHPFLKLLG